MEKEKSKSSVISAQTTSFETDLSRGQGGPAEEHERSEPTFAVCVRNDGYTVSLERHKIYRVLPDSEALQDHELRVVDESGEDYLFPASFFMPLSLPRAIQEALLVTG